MNDDGKVFRNYERARLDSHYFIRGRLLEQDMVCMVEDVRSVFTWAGTHIADYVGDPARIFVCGHSARGQLAALVAATDWSTGIGSLYADLIKGFVGISGVYDLRPIQDCFLNNIGFLDDATVARYGATQQVPADRRWGLGTEEGAEFERQSRTQAGLWQTAGVNTVIEAIPDLGHATTIEQLHHPDSPLCILMRELIFSGGD